MLVSIIYHCVDANQPAIDIISKVSLIIRDFLRWLALKSVGSGVVGSSLIPVPENYNIYLVCTTS